MPPRARPPSPPALTALSLLTLTLALPACQRSTQPPLVGGPSSTTPTSQPAPATPAPDTAYWQPLFSPTELAPWKPTNFGGEGEVRVEDGRILIPTGEPATGITWAADHPPFRMNYELELEARRESGSDFFCALTFPVADSYCSLICGGWGGGVTGLSSLNGYDASENDTSQWINYEQNRWYKFRVRVTQKQIEVWMDDKPIVDADTEFRPVSIRIEVYPSRPLGISTWRTTGAVRNIRWRHVDAPDSL